MHISLASTAVLVGAAAASLTIPLRRESSAALALSKRRTITLDTAYKATGGGYYAEIQVGSPPQTVKVHLDTGSSDTWVNSADSGLCDGGEYVGCDGFFRPQNSSTFDIIDKGGFSTKYLDQRNVSGNFFRDTVTIGGVAVDNQTLGLVTNKTPGQGLLALGLRHGSSAEASYPTVVDNLVSQGHMRRAAFSIFLNSSDADSASILFGGIDTKKFIGDLATIPITRAPDGSAIAWVVPLMSVAAHDLNVTAALDTGSTLTFLPPQVAEAIWERVDAKIVLGTALIDCKTAASNATVDFRFGNKTIEVPVSELAVKAPISALLEQLPVDLDDPCVFGIQKSSHGGADSFAVIGDSVLRSAYVVYDATNLQIGIAQANVGTSDSEIHDLDAGSELPSSGVSPTAVDNSAPDHGNKESGAAAIAPGWIALMSIVLLLV